jgi:hypothetical protein
VSKYLIAYACFAGAVFFGLMLYMALFRWQQAQASAARHGRPMPRWAAIALTASLTLLCLWISANTYMQAKRLDLAHNSTVATEGSQAGIDEPAENRSELVMLAPSEPPPKPTVEQIAAANSALELMQRIDVLVSTGRLGDDLTYYRTFDTPLTNEQKKWQLDWPSTHLMSCRDALNFLQVSGMAVRTAMRDSTHTKYAEQDWEKYQHLKRRCKAAIAGDIAEAERRS